MVELAIDRLARTVRSASSAEEREHISSSTLQSSFQLFELNQPCGRVQGVDDCLQEPPALAARHSRCHPSLHHSPCASQVRTSSIRWPLCRSKLRLGLSGTRQSAPCYLAAHLSGRGLPLDISIDSFYIFSTLANSARVEPFMASGLYGSKSSAILDSESINSPLSVRFKCKN